MRMKRKKVDDEFDSSERLVITRGGKNKLQKAGENHSKFGKGGTAHNYAKLGVPGDRSRRDKGGVDFTNSRSRDTKWVDW